MDAFPHVSIEHEVLKRHIKYSFNPEKCQKAGLDHLPTAEDYELLKLRRVYHFNRNTPDHIVLTIPRPVFLLIDRETSESLEGFNQVATSRKSEDREIIINRNNEQESNEINFIHEPVDILGSLGTNERFISVRNNVSDPFDDCKDFNFLMLINERLSFTYETGGFVQNLARRYLDVCNRSNNEAYVINGNNFGNFHLEVVKSQFNIPNPSFTYFGRVIKKMRQYMLEEGKTTIKLLQETHLGCLRLNLHLTKNVASNVFKIQLIKLLSSNVWQKDKINQRSISALGGINCTKGSCGPNITFSIATKHFNIDARLKNNSITYYETVIDEKKIIKNVSTLFSNLSQKVPVHRKRNVRRHLLENTRRSEGQMVKEVYLHQTGLSHCVNSARRSYLRTVEKTSISEEPPLKVPKVDFLGFSEEEQTVAGEINQIQSFIDILNKAISTPWEAFPKCEKLEIIRPIQQQARVVKITQRCEYVPIVKRIEHRLKQQPHKPSNKPQKSKLVCFPEELFECEQCGYITMYRSKLDAHMEIHDMKQIYRCNICSFSTAQLTYFKTHQLFHHIEVKKPFKTENEENYRCDKCGFSTKLRYAMVHHGKEDHSEEAFINVTMVGSGRKKKMCTRCTYSGQKKTFHKHLAGNKKHKCDFCGFVIYNNRRSRTDCVNNGKCT